LKVWSTALPLPKKELRLPAYRCWQHGIDPHLLETHEFVCPSDSIYNQVEFRNTNVLKNQQYFVDFYFLRLGSQNNHGEYGADSKYEIHYTNSLRNKLFKH